MIESDQKQVVITNFYFHLSHGPEPNLKTDATTLPIYYFAYLHLTTTLLIYWKDSQFLKAFIPNLS